MKLNSLFLFDNRGRGVPGLFMAFLLLCSPLPLVGSTESGQLRELTQSRIEELRGVGRLTIGDTEIASVALLPLFYEQRDFQPAWVGHRANAEKLVQLIEKSRDEGLNPADYHGFQIRQMLNELAVQQGPSNANLVDLDIILTDSLIRYAYHRRFGKVNPEGLDPHWNFGRSIAGIDPVENLRAAMEAGSIVAYLDQFAPQLPFYNRLKRALRKYRAIEQDGGWPIVPAGKSLKPGISDPRVKMVRERLLISGDLEPTAVENPTLFDDEIVNGVRRFQHRHGLEPDGVVGRQTLAAMNVPVGDRIDQIRVNLERGRWVAQDVPEEFIIVDIAGFRASLMRDGEVVWDERVQVGKPFRKTPVFRSNMSYLEMNPTWTVPPTILEEDILPKVKQDLLYLAEKNMRVLDYEGRDVDPVTLDWNAYNGRNFPYLLRQGPGPTNALGRIKFMFPNDHLVYLHDTPSKSLFERNQRAFSSGCIRIENPYRLAELLLRDEQKWGREEILEVIDSGDTRRVNLPQSVPVLLLYWTVAVDDDRVMFKPDLYERDGRVLEGLNGEFLFRLPKDAPEWIKSASSKS